MNTEDPLPQIFQDVWPEAFEDVHALHEAAAKPGTPAFEAMGAERCAREIQKLYMRKAVEGALRSHLVLFSAVKAGVVAAPVAELIQSKAISYTRGVVEGLRCFCPQAPCEWRGTVDESGPAGECPTCKHRPVQLSPMATPPPPRASS